jgi:predicted DNA-binding protein (MmcQ/YjbR family)
MAYEWINEYFMEKEGTRKDYQPDWQATRYFLSDKMYAMIGGDKNGEPIVTMKCDPVFAEVLRKTYKGIVPGYYMNKRHWNTMYLNEAIPDEVVEDMINTAYRLVFDALPVKKREEMLRGEKP